jgi:hypothetical protein
MGSGGNKLVFSTAVFFNKHRLTVWLDGWIGEGVGCSKVSIG